MVQTFEAVIDEQGAIHLLEAVHLTAPRRALVLGAGGVLGFAWTLGALAAVDEKKLVAVRIPIIKRHGVGAAGHIDFDILVAEKSDGGSLRVVVRVDEDGHER